MRTSRAALLRKCLMQKFAGHSFDCITISRYTVKLLHKKAKITVLRTEYYQELAEQYAIPNLGMCPFHQKGQVLYSDGINPPEGMCGVAWQVIGPMVRRLSEGQTVQPTGTWLNDDSICVFACPDGIRPVIFLLEAQDNSIPL